MSEIFIPSIAPAASGDREIKREWFAPTLTRIAAGSAENADQQGSDDGVNLAS